MDKLKIIRKRIIPFETIPLNDDKIILHTESILVTKWKTLKPRNDFDNGISIYFFKEGYKISKFMDKNGDLVYYYCDIIDTDFNKEENTYIFTDLLADVILFENKNIKIMDIDELAYAYDKNLISLEMLKNSLNRLSTLLNVVHSDKIPDMFKKYE